MNELTKPIKGQKQKPMNEMLFQSIMGEYLIDCSEYNEYTLVRIEKI